MKRLLSLVTLALVVMAIFAIRYAGKGVAAVPEGAAVAPATVHLPAPAITRQAALEYGRMRAKSFFEDDAVPIGAVLTTLGTANSKVAVGDVGSRPDGPVGPDGQQALFPEDTQVWLVRMRGSFVAPHGLIRKDPTTGRLDRGEPTPGWMFTIIDATTGQTIYTGFRGNGVPLR